MIPMMMLAMSGAKTVTQTFTANGTWVAPVAQIATLIGKGQDGTAAYDDTRTNYYNDKYKYRVRHYANGGTNVGSATLIARDLTSQFASIPGSYCDATVSGSDGSPPVVVGGVSYPVTSYEDCYYFTRTTITFGGPHPATTGASTTGIGKTFPGGAGGPASTLTFNNVAVTPGQSYSIVVPTGGFLTITYTT